jgi:hypothetical protein
MISAQVIDFHVGVTIPSGIAIIAHHYDGNKNMLLDCAETERLDDASAVLHAAVTANKMISEYLKKHDAIQGEKTSFCYERPGQGWTQRECELAGMWRLAAMCAMEWGMLDEDDTHRGVGGPRWRRDLYDDQGARPNSPKRWAIWTRGFVALTYGKTIDRKKRGAADAVCIATWAAERAKAARDAAKAARKAADDA